MKEQLLQIGTKVFDIRFGWGEIEDYTTEEKYPYKVIFSNVEDVVFTYNIAGKPIDYYVNPTLSLTEYDLVNGGFTPLSDYNKPKVGDFGYFWDDNDVESAQRIVYSKIIKINKYDYFDSAEINWQNFSKEIPEWFLKKMNK
jgi:hypothetical protein